MVTVTLESMTQEWAAKLLADRHINSPISENQVQMICADMRAGRWRGENGNTIKLCPDGRLIDGQNRLTAILRAGGIVVPMLIARGVDPDAETFRTIGDCRRRSVGDNLARQGIPNYVQVATAARAALIYVAGLSGKHSTSELLEFIERYPYLREAQAVVSQTRPFTTSQVAAVLFLANTKRRRDALVADFGDGLRTGASLDLGDPRLTLRNWHMAGRGLHRVRGKATTRDCFEAAVRAWNAFAAGRSLSSIRGYPGWPEITGFDARAFADYLKTAPPEPEQRSPTRQRRPEPERHPPPQ